MDQDDARTPPETPTTDGATTPSVDPAGLLQQWTAATARLWGASPALPALPSVPAFPQLGALTDRQVSAMVSTVRAQRQSIAALQAQLAAFDENLASLEQLLEPLRAWSASWAGLERGLGPRPPEPPPS